MFFHSMLITGLRQISPPSQDCMCPVGSLKLTGLLHTRSDSRSAGLIDLEYPCLAE